MMEAGGVLLSCEQGCWRVLLHRCAELPADPMLTATASCLPPHSQWRPLCCCCCCYCLLPSPPPPPVFPVPARPHTRQVSGHSLPRQVGLTGQDSSSRCSSSSSKAAGQQFGVLCSGDDILVWFYRLQDSGAARCAPLLCKLQPTGLLCYKHSFWLFYMLCRPRT